MNRTNRSRLFLAVGMGISVLLIITGVCLCFHVCRSFEHVMANYAHFDQIRKPLHAVALRLAADLGLIFAGIFGMVLTLSRRLSRSRSQITDLEQKNAAMDELIRKQQQLAHHQRLETLGTMTSSIAHEFNNLLTPIMGYSMMALEKLPPEETELYDNILEIYTASRKAKQIISRLSDLSRKSSGDVIRPISPDDLVRKTLEAAAPARPEQVQVKLGLNCWDQRIPANEIQIAQLLLNLILNAFHAMEPEGGTLHVDTWFDQTCVHIRLSDTGCGIPPEILPHIFDPFFTTKESGKGTGLGLAIAAQVVEDHHGDIRVESTPGVGTTFFVTLPRQSPSSPG